MKNKSYFAIIILGIVTLASGLFGLINSVLKSDWFLIAYNTIFILFGIGIITLKSWARIAVLILSWLVLISAPVVLILIILPNIFTHKAIIPIISSFFLPFTIVLFYSLFAVLVLTRSNIKAQFKTHSSQNSKIKK